jgi:hypothetical protein
MAPEPAHDPAQEEHLPDGRPRVLAGGHDVRGVDHVLDDLEPQTDDGTQDEAVDG